MDFQSIANVSSAAACGAHVYSTVYCIAQKPLPPPQDLPSFAFNVALMAREGLTGGTQLMAATVSVSNMVPRLFFAF